MYFLFIVLYKKHKQVYNKANKLKGSESMKQYHYKELHNMKDLNLFQKISETGYTAWYVILTILLVLSISLLLICMFKRYKRLGFLAIAISIVIALTIIGLTIDVTTKYESVGYYRAEAKVISIDKQEKVGEGTQYTVSCRYMTGNIEDKKTKPVKITTRQKGFKNGEHVMIKTPQMLFKGGEDQRVSDQLLITDRQRTIGEAWSIDEEIPKHVDMKDLKIEKRSG